MFDSGLVQIRFRCGSYSVQIWFNSTDTPSFDDTFFPVVGFSVGFTHRPWAWQSHVAIAYVGSVFTHWLHTPATGEDPLAPPTHRPRAWQSQAVRCSLRSHGHLHMEDPQGGVGRLEGADDREDTPVWLDSCVRGPVPRLRQAQDAFGPVVVRNQIWLRLGSMVAPVLFSFGS